MTPDMQNMAMAQGLEGGGPSAGGGQGGPGPVIPPELMALAFEMGLDIRNPEHLMILIKMLGQGGGGPMGPMAPTGPGAGAAPSPMPPQGGGGF